MGFTEVFGGNTIFPADVSYLALALTGDIQFDWPVESAAPPYPLARIIDVMTNSGHTMRLPDATMASPGETALFNILTASSATCFLVDYDGVNLGVLAPGEQWEIYLTDNTTQAGQWEIFRFGASTATVQPSALAGYGIVVTGSTLSQSVPVVTFDASPQTVTPAHRASALVWTGPGSGVLNLPGVSAVGNNYFFSARNAGGGMLTLDPLGGEQIDGGATVALSPGEGVVLITDGLVWYTLGRGQAAVFAFDYTAIDVSPGGTYTLTGSELNRVAYRFTGVLTTDVIVVVPSTVQQYWVDNSTTGPFGLSLSTAGGTPVAVPQGARAILYCDGTNVIDAETGGISTPVNASDGGTGHSSYVIGDMLTASSPATLARLAAAPVGNALIAMGTGTMPAWGQIDLTNSVTGILPPANGGTGSTLAAFTTNYHIKGGPAGQLVSSTTLLDTGTNVGIGTPNPASTLHVKSAQGAVIVEATQDANGNFVCVNTIASWSMGMLGALGWDRWSLYNNLTVKETITALQNGNVGIGAAGPTHKLQVAGPTRISNVDPTAGSNATIYPNADGAQGAILEVSNASGGFGPFKLFTGGAEHFRVAADGLITVPGQRPVGISGASGGVSVQGDVGGWEIGYRIQGADGNIVGSFAALGSGNALSYQYMGAVYNNGSSLKVFPDGNTSIGGGAGNPGIRLKVEATVDGGPLPLLALNNAGSGANTGATINFAAASTTYAQITGGYGTSSPRLLYDALAGGIHTFATDGSERVRIRANGAVHIGPGASGTGYPSRLHVTDLAGSPATWDASQGFTIGELSQNNLYYLKSGMMTVAGAWTGFIQQVSNNVPNNLILNPGGGKVGIGNTQPAEALDVRGNALLYQPGTGATYIQVKNDAGSVYLAQDNVGGYVLTPGATPFRIYTAGTERVRVNDLGNVGIGLPNPDYRLHAYNTNCVIMAQDPSGVNIHIQATNASARLGTSSGTIYFLISNLIKVTMDSSYFYPNGVGMSIGAPTAPWDVIYAANGTIQPSDERQKNWLGGLSAAELAAAKTIAQGIGKFRWLDSTLGADTHVGVKAQAVVAAMAAQGLDALSYGFVHYDEWDALEAEPDVEASAAVIDEETGDVIQPAVTPVAGVPGREAGNRYSVNYAELGMFIAAAQEQRLAALEALL